MGDVLIPYNHFPMFYVQIGAGGNGKTYLIEECMARVVGFDNFSQIRLKHLIGDSKHQTKAMENKLFVYDDDAQKTSLSKFDEIKVLSGSKILRVEPKGTDPYNTINTSTLIVNTNNKLTFDEGADALERRMRILPFDFKLVNPKFD